MNTDPHMGQDASSWRVSLPIIGGRFAATMLGCASQLGSGILPIIIYIYMYLSILYILMYNWGTIWYAVIIYPLVDGTALPSMHMEAS